MAYTILQASYFMEVWLTPALGFDPANGKVRLYGDGSRGMAWPDCPANVRLYLSDA